MNFELKVIGRSNPLFETDIKNYNKLINETLKKSRILVVGAAGSIGKAVTSELFCRNTKSLHAVDISENNLVELVRHIRSSHGYLTEDFQTFCLDVSSKEFDVFFNSQKAYDYIFNLSALKHVRSEKDPFTLMRMLEVNVLNSIKLQSFCKNSNNTKYFCVSSDKAANPANLMGASKRIMELFAFSKAQKVNTSMARFANVAFSDGSLLHGFTQRLIAKQPITAPTDIKRYFITPKEAGRLCLLSAILGKRGEIFFPSNDNELTPISFDKIAIKYIIDNGFEPYICKTEDEARYFFLEKHKNKWPCYFFKTDTTGEKFLEEFYTSEEDKYFDKFTEIGVVKPNFKVDDILLNNFLKNINQLKINGNWSKIDIIEEIIKILPNLDYADNGKYLDGKM